MKKLLTIMVLALALCLLCGAALADGDPAEFVWTSPNWPTNASTVMLDMDGDETKCQYKIQTNVANAKCGDTMTLEFKCEAGIEKDTVVFTRYTFNHGDGTLNREHKANGTTTYECNHCHQTITIAAADVPMTDHNAAGFEWKMIKEPTCSEKGESNYICKTCGFKHPDFDTQYSSLSAHVPTLVVDEYPTCVEPGIGELHWECKFCGCLVDSATAKEVKIPEIVRPANIAAFAAAIGDADYTGHAYGAFSLRKAATCKNESVWIKSCPLCNTSVEKKYHEINDGKYDNLGSKYELAKTVRDENDCWKLTATFKCSICGGGGGTKCGDITATFIDGAVDTAAFAGGKGYKKECDTSLAANQYSSIADAKKLVGLTGAQVQFVMHTFDLTKDPIATIQASCTTAGYKIYACTKCAANVKHTTLAPLVTINGNPYNKDSLYYLKTAEQLPHKWNGYVVEIEPDAENGVFGKWVRTCSVCGTTDNFVSFLPPADLCDGKHTPVLDEIFSFEPDCENPGYNFYYCSVCGIDLDDLTEEIPALDHKWDVTVKTPSTCKEAGKANRICERCHLAEIDVDLPLADHTWSDWAVTTPATVTTKGVETRKCSVCEKEETREVDYVPTEPAKYEMTAEYDGKTVKGKLVHDPATVEAATKNIRVTFYVEGNYYMATMAEVNEDGTFSVDGVGPIVYITVAATTNSSVNPEAYEAIATPIEIEVK